MGGKWKCKWLIWVMYCMNALQDFKRFVKWILSRNHDIFSPLFVLKVKSWNLCCAFFSTSLMILYFTNIISLIAREKVVHLHWHLPTITGKKSLNDRKTWSHDKTRSYDWSLKYSSIVQPSWKDMAFLFAYKSPLLCIK